MQVARDSFIHALAGSMRLSLAVVIAGIAGAAVLIKGRGAPARQPVQEHHPDAVAEPLGAQ
jgi:hypothetical protein